MPKPMQHILTVQDLITYLETRKQLIERQRNGRKFSWESGAIYAFEQAISAVQQLEQSGATKAKPVPSS